MPTTRSKDMLRAEELALQFGLSAKAVWKSGAWRPMAEHARMLLVNGMRRSKGLAPIELPADPEQTPDPVIVAMERAFPAKRVDLDRFNAECAAVTISETDDSISITIPKRPVEKMSREQASAVLAVRRAGGKR